MCYRHSSVKDCDILATLASKWVDFTDTMETFNFTILQVFETIPWFKHYLPGYLNTQMGKLNSSGVTP